MSVDTIGERVRALRKERGLSQEEVARRTGVSLGSYGDIERGVTTDPHYSTLRGISRALGVPIEELLLDEELAAPLGEPPPETWSIDDYAAATAGAKISGTAEWAEGLAAEWEREEAQSARISKYRTFEMSCAVLVLYQQFWEALGILQNQARGLGLAPNPATWEPESKRRLFESGSSIRKLAGLYERIRQSAEDTEEEEVSKFAEQLDAFIAALDYEKAG